MGEKFVELHFEILCSIHSLVFDGYGLPEGVNKKLLSDWYYNSNGMEERVNKIVGDLLKCQDEKGNIHKD